MPDKIYIDKDGAQIDLSELTLKELEDLNLIEEEYFAEEIKKKKAFSTERNSYIKESYQKIFQISDWKKVKSNNNDKKNGVKDNTLHLLKKIINKELKKKENIIFYEAGVGKGVALQTIKNEKVFIYGCDVFLSDEAKEIEKSNENIWLVEKDLYNALDEVEDGYIDIFYADNVLEHLVPDEYEETIRKIVQKMKNNGTAIFIIPNSYIGPNDISKISKPIGSKATGFHLMEQSFSENVNIFNRSNLKLQYICWINRKGEIKYIRDFLALSILKIKAEKFLGKIKKGTVRKRLFKHLGYDIYILKNKQ